MIVEEEDALVIHQIRSELGTPGSSDTHVTQDTPTNEDELANRGRKKQL